MPLSLTDVQIKMSKVLEFLKNDLMTIRTGRATPALVENLEIEVYGGTQKLKLKELGTITALDAKTLVVSPWDQSIIEEINKGILTANIGLTPVIDGQVVRISIPPLSQERRVEYVKLLKQKLEAGRIMIRQIRHDFLSDLKRAYEAGEISEDEKNRQVKEVQDLTDKMNAQITEMGEVKEKELRTI